MIVVKAKLAIGSTVAAVAVVAGGSLLLADKDDEVSVDELVPALNRVQTPADVPSENIRLDALGGIKRDSIRKIFSDERAAFYVGEAGLDELCLVAHILSGSDVGGSTCADAIHLYQRGLALEVGTGSGPTRSVQSYLIPGDVDVSTLSESAPLERSAARDGVNPLVIYPDVEKAPAAMQLPRQGGGEFFFAPLNGRRE